MAYVSTGRRLLTVLLLACATACGAPEHAPTPDPEQQRRELAGVSVTIRVEEETFGAVLAGLAHQTDRPIGMSADAAGRYLDTVSAFVLEDVSLVTVLNMLEAMTEDLIWIPDGRGALFDLRSNHPEQLVVQIHALGDLTAGLVGGGWRPPVINEEALDEDLPDEDTPLFGDPDDEDYGLGPDEVEALLAEIRATFPAGTWDAPAYLRTQGRSTLVAKQTEAVHEALAEFLDEWRAGR